MADSNLKIKEIPLTGKMITSVDPITIGENFRTLKNLRYTDTNPRGVGGMTKINSTALTTYLKPRSGIHFKKEQPAESHVLVQAWNTGETGAQVLQNTTAIPNAGDFSATALHTDASGAGTGLFSDAPGGNVVYSNGVETMIWGGDEFRCAGFINFDDSGGTFSYDFTEQVTNTLSDAQNVATLTSVGGDKMYLYIGATRPIKGVKFTVGTANTTAATLSGEYWDGSAWQSLTTFVDGIASGGNPFAQTGSVTFDDTESVAKVQVIEQVQLYWYKFETSTTIDNTTTITYCTVDAAFQSVKDIWDGESRIVLDAQLWDDSASDFHDNTLQITEADYNASSPATYMHLGFGGGNFQVADFILLGFTERQMGLFFKIGDEKNNTTAAVLTINYWNGTAWTSVGTLVDGTLNSAGTKSVSQSGVITWNSPDADAETKRTVGEGDKLYYYQLTWNGILSAPRVDQIEGIPTPLSIKPHRFSTLAQERLWLGNEVAGDKNSAICTARNTTEVFNGDEVEKFFFGDEKALTAGIGLYGQFGSSLYDMVVFCKVDETHVVTGSNPEDWVQFQASKTIGCVAPQTMKTVNITVAGQATPNKQVVIWQGTHGIYLFDGRSPVPISSDISNFFDPLDSSSINSSKVGDSEAFVDDVNQEYHWLFASGTSTTLDREFVFDLKRQKWYEVDRGTDLQVGIEVEDTSGNEYTYGGIDTGYLERLENGTDFDGTDITHELFLGDIAPEKDTVSLDTTVRGIRLHMIAKANTSNEVAVTHYGDTKTAGTSLDAMSPISSGKRIANVLKGCKKGPYNYHGFKFTMATNDETIGFEPIFVSLFYKIDRVDILQ